ncbi:OLC1v1015714C1 [Oldenlandia corymbosa var. corymbosa]|uniref:OLC1v1015714C1 n=1 Tax=Oldenlandia corymbosa var. corymbosa TaxID=529605 RepID=A0AAV1E4C7_OLDCO|nr:OLC1v1015714C1 [Oldenlandia corymbosa var. corymbosa]
MCDSDPATVEMDDEIENVYTEGIKLQGAQPTALMKESVPEEITAVDKSAIPSNDLMTDAVLRLASKPKLFRFQQMWLRRAEFKDVVQESWSQPVRGFGMLAFSTKLRRLKMKLKELNKEPFGDVFKNLKLADDRVHDMEIVFDHSGLSEKEMLVGMVTMDEVKHEVFALGEDSAPGVDGFGGSFYSSQANGEKVSMVSLARLKWREARALEVMRSFKFPTSENGLEAAKRKATWIQIKSVDYEAIRQTKVQGGDRSFWFDNWAPDGVIWESLHESPIMPNLTINEFFSNKITLLSALQRSLSPIVRQKLTHMDLILNDERDKLVGQCTASGEFTIKLANFRLRRRHLENLLARKFWHKASGQVFGTFSGNTMSFWYSCQAFHAFVL